MTSPRRDPVNDGGEYSKPHKQMISAVNNIFGEYDMGGDSFLSRKTNYKKQALLGADTIKKRLRFC